MRWIAAFVLGLGAVASWGMAGEEVTLEVDGAVLSGTLLLSDSATELVILHAGSGPTDRDGNQAGMTNNSLKMLAEALAEQGLAVLRYDKRGVGGSTMSGAEADLRPGHFVDDLVAWVSWARQHYPGQDIHLLGHSEGALFAKAAATRAHVNTVLAVAGAGRPAGVILREQTEGRRPGEVGVQFEHILGELEAGRKVDEVMPLLAALFRPSVQPYLIEWLAMRPVDLAAALDVPLLVIGGSGDLQVGRADFEALSAQASDAVWVEGMNHVLKVADGPIEQQLEVYMDPDQPLHEALVPAITAFLKAAEPASRDSG